MPIRSVRANTSDAPDPTFEITDSEKAKGFSQERRWVTAVQVLQKRCKP